MPSVWYLVYAALDKIVGNILLICLCFKQKLFYCDKHACVGLRVLVQFFRFRKVAGLCLGVRHPLLLRTSSRVEPQAELSKSLLIQCLHTVCLT